MSLLDRTGLARSITVAAVALFLVTGVALAGQELTSSNLQQPAGPTPALTNATGLISEDASSPSATPEVSETPEPTRTPEPTGSPAAMESPEATETPAIRLFLAATSSPEDAGKQDQDGDRAGAAPTERPEATETPGYEQDGLGTNEARPTPSATPASPWTGKPSDGGGDVGGQGGPDARGANGG